jgi:hypothetical protein
LGERELREGWVEEDYRHEGRGLQGLFKSILYIQGFENNIVFALWVETVRRERQGEIE